MSRNLIPVLSATVLVALAFTRGANGQEETLCRGVALNMTDAQKGVIADCLTENKIKSVWKIPVEKLTCFGVCVLRKKDLLTPGGKIDHEKLFAYIDVVMKPDEVKKPLKEGMDKCIKDHGDKVQANDDPKCASFMEVGQCIHDVFLELCISDD